MARVLVWRHGRTEWNASGRFQGQLDPPLDDTGRAQARRAAEALAAELPAEALVVTSDLVRARDTAQALADSLGTRLRIEPRLREHGLGSWEGRTREDVARDLPEQYADWTHGRPVRGRGGEDPADVARRALAAVADLPPAPVAVLVTHGGTGGRLIEALLSLGPEHRRIFGPLGNCHWTELAHQGSRWRVLRHNASATGGAPGIPRRSGADTGPDVAEAAGVADAAPAAGGQPVAAGATPEEAPPAPTDADALS
ncbi:histidine phosphatase family protein [Klenkia sp. PcliD-1-E]|uniref:histidine phosphatase family protein n=1 Tax=Klenkia sp. PcliD-1-E TaxID=2954492 RepID=UPI0020970C81|nr:histidine phosphatase family protein [Klenkia sp. PcliD-1-E]MCO7220633.1 histidine phosphatase family protein [Klenkia sp. PcliD-1-E]